MPPNAYSDDMPLPFRVDGPASLPICWPGVVRALRTITVCSAAWVLGVWGLVQIGGGR